MELLIKTLTPLWTGGVDTSVDRIHETGILGGLRWWLEVFVRGLGGWVNDPTQNERSGFDQDKYNKSKAIDIRSHLRDAGLCDVSQILGATGWRRRFRLDVRGNTSPDLSVAATIHADRQGKTRPSTWYFPKKPRSGQLAIKIQSLAQDFQPEIMAGLVQFISDWAAIGARAQMGFGVIEPVNNRFDTQSLYDWLVAAVGSESYPRLPSLQNIFLARIHKPNAIDPERGAAEDKALFTYEALPRTTFLTAEIVLDDYRDGANGRPFPKNTTARNNPLPGGSWSGPLDVAKAGLRMIEWLGVRGMGTRGFGRMATIGEPLVQQFGQEAWQ